MFKAITLLQPWASLIIDKRKPVETRSWQTDYRGTIAIHTSIKNNKEVKDACLKFGYDPKTVIRGAVIGTVMLVTCVKFPSKLVKIDDYGDFTPGRYGWILADVKQFKEPIPAKGMLGLWNWNYKGQFDTSLF